MPKKMIVERRLKDARFEDTEEGRDMGATLRRSFGAREVFRALRGFHSYKSAHLVGFGGE